MATPARETRQSVALSSEDELFGEGRSRQRSRRLPGKDDDSIVWDLNDEGRPKTRRVNPQRLALRLGPELVAEMEAYIVPGAKMPSFSVRKDFQERYSVDRRHIYDYFHSRGLRVAKEDKHTNLIRGRAMKAKTVGQTLLVSQTPTKASSEATKGLTVDNARSLFTPKSTNEKSRTTKRPAKIRERKSVMRPPVKKPRDPVFAAPDSMPGQGSSESGALSISGTDSNWDSTSTQFALACDSSDESIATSAASDFLPSNDFLVGFFGADHLPQNLSGIESFSIDEEHTSMDQERLLTKGERTELYDLISGSISSSVSVGAGSSDIVLSIDNTIRGSRRYPDENAGKPHLACNTCLNTFEANHCVHDLKTWLSDDLDLQLAMETHFLPSLRDNLDGYAWFHDSSIVNSAYGMTGNYPQAAILASQNRSPPSKVPISVACVKQHIEDHAKRDAENVHPGTHFHSR